MDACVRFENVWKRFHLGESHDSLRDLLSSGARRILRGRHAHPTRDGHGHRSTFWALRDVAFSVRRGEAVGIIGPNGAGKSTVLKLLARILRPDRGRVTVIGRLAALIEIGAGFHGDLTGRENVYLNGSILGMTRREIKRKLDSIVSFAGLERFLEMPVKRYSSGMYARLGFSIATHVEPDVLLVDEVLSVGDAMFRLRCVDRMRGLVESGTALVFVTHDLDQMKSICRDAIVLDQGRTAFTGSAEEAIDHYLRAMMQAEAERTGDLAGSAIRSGAAAELLGLRFLDKHGSEVLKVGPDDALQIEFRYRMRRPVPRLVVELNMRGARYDNLLSFNSGRDGRAFHAPLGTWTMTLAVDRISVTGGQYAWNVRMWDADTGTVEVDTGYRHPLVINDRGCKSGMVHAPHRWEVPIDSENDVVSLQRTAESATIVSIDSKDENVHPRTLGACR